MMEKRWTLRICGLGSSLTMALLQPGPRYGTRERASLPLRFSCQFRRSKRAIARETDDPRGSGPPCTCTTTRTRRSTAHRTSADGSPTRARAREGYPQAGNSSGWPGGVTGLGQRSAGAQPFPHALVRGAPPLGNGLPLRRPHRLRVLLASREPRQGDRGGASPKRTGANTDDRGKVGRTISTTDCGC
jgi:hypothetical protein